MDLPALTLTAGIVLAVFGAAGLAYSFSHRSRPEPGQPDLPSSELPEGVNEVLAVLRSAVFVVDLADRVVKATPAALAYGVVKDGKIVSQDLLDLVRKVHRDGLIEDREMEVARNEHAEPLLLDIRVAPLGPMHVLGLINDRTEARRVEETRRDFVANVSHELKTPVGAILLLAETLQEAADDPEAVRRFGQRLQTESGRLTQLVQEIIDLSRLQAAHGVASPTAVSVDEVVAEAADRHRLAAEAKDIVVDVGGARNAIIRGDRGLMVTAVSNLIDNAIRYSDPSTRIGIGVSIVQSTVQIAVTDEGIGIPVTERERVFERFYRVDPARSRATGGTGLGLSIVKHIAANHGGDVRVWSKPGAGSTFTLRLPLAGVLAPRLVPPDPSQSTSFRRIRA